MNLFKTLAMTQVFQDARLQWEMKPDRVLFGTMLVAAGASDPTWVSCLHARAAQSYGIRHALHILNG